MKFKLHITQEVIVNADSLQFAKELITRDPPHVDRGGYSMSRGGYRIKTGKVIKVVRKNR